MASYQKDKKEVQDFLEKVKDIILQHKKVLLNAAPWKGNRVNKTLAYMAETGINQKDIEKIICELQVTHYSYTADDRNENFKDEQVWIFGMTKNMIDKDVDLYIKLKIRRIGEEILLIMSFHPEYPGLNNHKLQFPYRKSDNE